jgi:hypothetical protein
MANEVTTFLGQKFDAIINLQAQQQDSRLFQAAMQGTHTGVKQAVAQNQLGSIVPRERTTRYPSLSFDDVPHFRRWVTPSHWFNAVPFDNVDELQILNDPKGSYVQTTLASLRRKKDDLFIAAATAASITGETGTGTTAFTAGNIVAVTFPGAVNTNLTLKKIKEGKRILLANEVLGAGEQIYCAVNADALDSLMDDIQIVSGDYQEKKVLATGAMPSPLGIQFIHTERLVNNPTYRSILMWVASGMHAGTWENVNTAISQRDDLEGRPWQVYTEGSWGVTRLEETKVVEILCEQL